MLQYNFKRIVRGDLHEKGTFAQILEGGRKKAMFTYERKRFQGEEKVSAKVQRPKNAWKVQGKARSPVGLDQSEQGEKSR